MGIDWVESAEKHYPIADGIHAIRNRQFFLPGFDIDPDTGEAVDLVIGPSRSGEALEVFVHRRAPRTTTIFHVLYLRHKTVARATAIIAKRKKGGNS